MLGFKPVDSSNWKDLEELFEARGGPHYCWCTAWRKVAFKDKPINKADKKNTLKGQAELNQPIGLLCYSDTTPVAWCSVAPRETYKTLRGDETLEQVWSIVCFFIKREFRGQGLNRQLIRAAIQYARANGGHYIEAYPVDTNASSYRFMGVKPVFEELGFRFIHKAGKHRNVMIRKL